MRGLLLALLLVPTASGLTVDLAAPQAIPLEDGALAVDVAVQTNEGPIEVKLWLGGEDWQASRTWNGTGFQRSDHYALEVHPGPEGHWEGRAWVTPNPSSANAQRLSSREEVILGLRARTPDERAEHLARRPPLEAETHAWAAPIPPQPLAIREDGETLARLGSPADPRPLRVPAPDTGLAVCREERCDQPFPWRLDRASEDEVELVQTSEQQARAGGVLVAGARACSLPANASQARWTIELAELEAAGRCRSTSEDPWVARLFADGREIGRAPERPGRGEVAWDPVQGDWAPWRLPSGVDPSPADPMHVEGHVEVFATRERGLAALETALDQARDRVTASTYLLTSRPAAELFARAADRGVDVQLWLEPDPVGGLPEETRGLVAWLEARGVSVHEAERPSDAGLLHAKVVVVDSSLLLVLTENLTDHGLPRHGEGNLGLGLGVANASLARRVEATFRDPGEGRAIRPEGWSPLSAPVQLLQAPENAWRASAVPAWIEDSPGPVQGAVLRASPRWGPVANPWLEALVNQSRRAPVDVVLSGAPQGAARANREAVAHLEAHPHAGDLDARLSDPRAGTVHAKVLATPDGALVGSSNWGMGGVLLNREINLLVHDPEVARQVADVLDEGTEPRSPGGPPLGDSLRTPAPVWSVLVAAGAAAWFPRRVSRSGGRPRARRRSS